MSNKRSWARLARRATEMRWDEVRTRARQEMAKRMDLALSSLGASFVEDRAASLPKACSHFFFEPVDVPPILAVLRRRLPDVVDEIVDRAERICRHRFDLLGYRNVDYGPHIDWHLDAVHNKRSPLHAWYKVPYLDFNRVGDSKITWELNRHQHLVTLAKAYRLTARPQFAMEMFEQWYDWQQQNPYPIGINWASSLEVAFRSLSWLWILHLLQGCAIVPTGFASDIRRALLLNGRHIARFPSTYFSPNTHLLGEGVGLFFIGTLCAAVATEMWQRQGWQIVLNAAQRQVRPDGMHFESSTYYHTYALDFFLHARVLAARNGISIPAAFDKTIETMLEVVLQLGRGGSLPCLGDDDGGRVFDPRRNRAEHMLDPLALGAIQYNRDDFTIAAGDLREEAVWLLGAERASRFDGSCGRAATPASFALKGSGVYVMSSSGPAAQQLVIHAGPSEPGRQGHRHADVLSVQLTIDGHDMLIDPGTYSYAGQDDARDYFRGTTAHNTVHVDGLSQGEPDGPFAWRSLGSAYVSRWVLGNTFDYFEGSHGGYRGLPDPVDHQRSIFFLKPRLWLVRDVLSGARVHETGVHWHFSRGYLAAKKNSARFVSDNQAELHLAFASNHPWSHDISTYCHSPEYGRREPAPLLRCTSKAMLPIELVTLLTASSTGAGELETLQPVVAESHAAFVRAYTYAPVADAGKKWFVFGTGPGAWSLGPMSSDARFLYAQIDRHGQLNGFALCDGSYLTFGPRMVLVADECLEHAEFFFEGDRPRFRCSNEDAVHITPMTEAENESRSDALAPV